MNIEKRNRIHRSLAETYAQLTRYLGPPGNTPGETETYAHGIIRTLAEYERALKRGVPELQRMVEAARQQIRRQQLDQLPEEFELPPGWEERAVERARAAGLFYRCGVITLL
jgi:hypothetical protein